MLSDTVVCPVSDVGVLYCGQRIRWIKMPLGVEVGLRPGDIVLDGDQLSQKGTHAAAPTFRPMSIVANSVGDQDAT